MGDRSIDIRATEAGYIGTLPEYWLVDVSVGFEAENYNLSLFVDNLFDERAITGRYTECAITTCFGEQYDVVARPMMIGLRFGQSF